MGKILRWMIVCATAVPLLAGCAGPNTRVITPLSSPNHVNVDVYVCQGSYNGQVLVDEDTARVQISGIDRSGLSDYAEAKPNTGGDRLMIYFDTGGDAAADLCLFAYRDGWTLRRDSAPGYFSIVLAEGTVDDLGNRAGIGMDIEFDASLIGGPIRRVWNYRPPAPQPAGEAPDES